jgi:hypothetical protein
VTDESNRLDAIAARIEDTLDTIDEATGTLRTILAEEPVQDLAAELRTLIEEAAAGIDAWVEKVSAVLERDTPTEEPAAEAPAEPEAGA